ncbi:MAG: argininosuccinate synthase [Deltaproteobacteria bacterium]|nr:argininosuccinate synthase [Deltaproteobacteria bacterium]
MSQPIILAYSGGLDTSFLVPYLNERYSSPIITVSVDTGGLTEDDRVRMKERALSIGATEHHLIDARSEYFSEVLKYLIMGNVLRGHLYPLSVGAERSLQARMVAHLALQKNARAIAHGSTAAGNDQVRFEVALRTLAPGLEILAPVRDEGFSREFEVNYLHERGHIFPAQRASYSVNSGLWGCTIGGRETNDTVEPLPEDAWVLSKGALNNPLPAETHYISYTSGVPTAIDDRNYEPVVLIEHLNILGARFAIGRGIHLGDTIFGLKGRVAFEAPAAAIIITCHRELEKLVLTAKQQRVKDMVSQIYGDLVHEAQYLEPVCRDIEALFISSQERVCGKVRFALRPGSIFVEGVSSPYSLKHASRGVYGEAAGEWSAADALGFSRLLGLPSILHAQVGGVPTTKGT